ncbi:MAG: hypothetical protein ACOC4K_05330 [Verrucomicrobiota bacterium]
MDRGIYAITLRCHGSLPEATQVRLKEIGRSLQSVEPASEEAVAFQRRQFAILEHAIDRAEGFRPFSRRQAADAMMEFFTEYAYEELSFEHWVVMPNHLYLITRPLICRNVDGRVNTTGYLK